VYLGFNLEHFAFGEGLGAGIAPPSPQPDVLNFSWRDDGNRVGAWRCLELFDQLGLPSAALINTALYEHAPDLLVETGYRYTLNWCHDDQALPMTTRSGQTLWSVPYPQELNDIPVIMARQMDAKDFSQMIVDNLHEMLVQAQQQPLVMGQHAGHHLRAHGVGSGIARPRSGGGQRLRLFDAGQQRCFWVRFAQHQGHAGFGSSGF
jgi:hypothetical protein